MTFSHTKESLSRNDQQGNHNHHPLRSLYNFQFHRIKNVKNISILLFIFKQSCFYNSSVFTIVTTNK